jgi:hypothetical protein
MRPMATRAFKERIRDAQQNTGFRGQFIHENRVLFVVDGKIRPDIIGERDLHSRISIMRRLYEARVVPAVEDHETTRLPDLSSQARNRIQGLVHIAPDTPISTRDAVTQPQTEPTGPV